VTASVEVASLGKGPHDGGRRGVTPPFLARGHGEETQAEAIGGVKPLEFESDFAATHCGAAASRENKHCFPNPYKKEKHSLVSLHFALSRFLLQWLHMHSLNPKPILCSKRNRSHMQGQHIQSVPKSQPSFENFM